MRREMALMDHPAAAVGIAALFLVSMLVITSGHPSPFLYFQF